MQCTMPRLMSCNLAVLMGAKRDRVSICIMLCALLFQHVKASNQDSLSSFLHGYALHTIPKPLTGMLYEVSPPANFSGVGVSLLRLRAHSLWKNGANLSSVQIPSTALPSPFTRRVDLVYQNLGNWSASYYNVPSYTFVAPVIGLLAYDSNAGPTTSLVGLDIKRDSPITVRFNINIVSLHRYEVRLMQCVRFATDGTWEFSNVTAESSCVARNHGHFSIVVPTMRGRGKTAAVKWWMVGIPGAVVGVVLIAVVGFWCRWRRVRKMVKMSERSEGLNTIWIGNSRMPNASDEWLRMCHVAAQEAHVA